MFCVTTAAIQGLAPYPLTTSIEDSGYQGIAAYHSNSYTPKKLW